MIIISIAAGQGLMCERFNIKMGEAQCTNTQAVDTFGCRKIIAQKLMR